jgi:hypothetical protein
VVKKLSSILLLCFLAATGQVYATITAVPDAIVFVDGALIGGYSGPFLPGPFTATHCYGPGDCITDTASFTYLNGGASVSDAQSSTGAADTLGSNEYVQFYFAVEGPSNISVPVTFAAAGNVSVDCTLDVVTGRCVAYTGNKATAVAFVSAPSFDDSPFLLGQYYTPGTQSFNTSETFSVMTNTAYYVNLGVSGEAEDMSQVSESIDPQVTLGPGAPAGYSLIFSANPTSIPEPTTLALLGVGLASLSFSRRRKLS